MKLEHCVEGFETDITYSTVDLASTAKTLAPLLRLLTVETGLQLRFHISSDRLARHCLRSDISVECMGPDASKVLEGDGEVLPSLEYMAAKMLGIEPESVSFFVTTGTRGFAPET